MQKRNARIIIIIIVAIAAVIWLFQQRPTVNQGDGGPKTTGHIIEKRYKIVLQDSKLDHKQEDFSDKNIASYFTDNIIDAHTYNFLQHLDDLVSNLSSEEEPLEKIRQYLDACLPADQAEKMFDLYSLYMDYQMNLQDQLKIQGMPRSPQEALDNLADLQEYRRAVFGKDNADVIFGASVEAQEFTIRRNAILYDDTLYGAEKAEMLKALGDDMWGDELIAQSSGAAYDRYQEALRLYQKDLSELRSDEERQDFLEQLHLETFDPVQRQALEEVDQAIDEEKQTTEEYYAREKEIRNDLYLTEPERAEKIRELQDATFGEEADAFRRREAMRQGLEQMKNSRANQDNP